MAVVGGDFYYSLAFFCDHLKRMGVLNSYPIAEDQTISAKREAA